MSAADLHEVTSEAIARGVCFSARYRGGALLLAPYSLSLSGGNHVLRAVVIEEDGERSPSTMRELDMTMLAEVALTRRTFLRDRRMEASARRTVG